MPLVHILNQYIWPDAAPTGVYAEQLAVALKEGGHDVRLVGGSGFYRKSTRPEPSVARVLISHFEGHRGRHLSTIKEYLSVHDAFSSYIKKEVRKGDVVIVSSAPPTTVSLAKDIQRAGAISIYWLQDYYPELIRGVWNYPRFLRPALRSYWSRQLKKWDRVVKVAGNIFGDGNDVRIIRNWPTIRFPEKPLKPEPKTAIYTGNLGYGHHLPSFIETCRELTAAGYELRIHADGPGVAQLPDWLPSRGPFSSEEKLSIALQAAEIHLVAGHPDIQHAVFPSKIWNSLALGRNIVATGFAQPMKDELNKLHDCSREGSLRDWCELVAQTVAE